MGKGSSGTEVVIPLAALSRYLLFFFVNSQPQIVRLPPKIPAAPQFGSPQEPHSASGRCPKPFLIPSLPRQRDAKARDADGGGSLLPEKQQN